MAFLLSIISVQLGDFFFFLGFFVIPKIDADPVSRKLLAPPYGPKSFMCYPYWSLWSGLLCGSCGASRPPTPRTPSMPTFFAYGTRKYVMFHSQFGIQRLQAADSRNLVKAYDCGHWIQHKKTDELAADMTAFFARK